MKNLLSYFLLLYFACSLFIFFASFLYFLGMAHILDYTFYGWPLKPDMPMEWETSFLRACSCISFSLFGASSILLFKSLKGEL